MGLLADRQAEAHPVLLAVVNVGPAALVDNLAGRPPPIGHDGRNGRGDHHPPHAAGLLGRAQHVQRPFDRRHHHLLLQPQTKWSRSVSGSGQGGESPGQWSGRSTWGSSTRSTVQGDARWKTPEHPRAASSRAAASRRSHRNTRRRPSPAAAASAWRWSVSALSSAARHRAS